MTTKEEQKAEQLLKNFSVALTGARPGDVIVAIKKANQGGMLRVLNGVVGPQKNKLQRLRAWPEIWRRFLEKLGALEFFSRMCTEEREQWLENNEFDSEYSVGQGPSGVQNDLEIIQLGGPMSARISDDRRAKLLAQDHCTYEDIEASVPKITKARRSILYLLPTWWRITVYFKVTTAASTNVSTIIDLRDGSVHTDGRALQSRRVYELPDIRGPNDARQSIGVCVWSDAEASASCPEPSCYPRVVNACKNFTLAAYKSLLQKLIRFRPKVVELNKDDLVPAKDVLVSVIQIMAKHRGTFVPDIQRFVSGVEALAKRLAVIIAEDAFTERPQDLVSLLGGALLAQRARRMWTPSAALLRRWIRIGCNAYDEPRAIDYRAYRNRRPHACVLAANQTPLETASALLDELRSFDGDLLLMRKWATGGSPRLLNVSNGRKVERMPLCHCVDQHWAPGVVHFLPLKYAKKILDDPSQRVKTSEPLRPLMQRMWWDCSSKNPRREAISDTFEIETKVKPLRQAQRRYLLALQEDPRQRARKDGTTFVVKRALDNAWLTGLVGSVDVKVGRTNMIVTINANEIDNLIAIKRPSRGKEKNHATSVEKERAVQEVLRRLNTVGLPMNQCVAPVEQLKRCRLFLEEGRYAVGNKRYDCVPWDDARQVEVSVPVHDGNTEYKLRDALLHRADGGVMEGATALLKYLVSNTDLRYVRRALTMLTTYEASIHFPRVNREGGGMQEAITSSDVGAFQFLLKVSYIYPAALTLRKYRPFTFDVRVSPLLWTVREKIAGLIRATYATASSSSWIPLKDKKGRTLKKEQTEIIDEMLERHGKGQRGHFIWASIGFGKTLTVLTFLQRLFADRQLPEYVVYTLPKSAMQTVMAECKYFDVPIHEIGRRTPRLRPGSINIIEHDVFRSVVDSILSNASETMFLVDEVHKTMNTTQRTATIQSFALLSRYFVVFTGTPVIDEKTVKLIPWLRQVVPFAVNEKNFYAAAATIITKLSDTGIEVVEIDSVATFTPEEKEAYDSRIPSALGGRNTNVQPNDMKEAVNICYAACNRTMVHETMRRLREGVLLVAKDMRHMRVLESMIREVRKDICMFCYDREKQLNLTDETVREGRTKDYKVVIVPKSISTGYNASTLSVMVTSVYPSNDADRKQMRGRINRTGSSHEKVTYITVHVGLLSSIHLRHCLAANLSQSIKNLVQQIDARRRESGHHLGAKRDRGASNDDNADSDAASKDDRVCQVPRYGDATEVATAMRQSEAGTEDDRQ